MRACNFSYKQNTNAIVAVPNSKHKHKRSIRGKTNWFTLNETFFLPNHHS